MYGSHVSFNMLRVMTGLDTLKLFVEIGEIRQILQNEPIIPLKIHITRPAN